MTPIQSIIKNHFAAEENRLARLKIFCEAAQLNFYAAKEEIAKACNDCFAKGFCLPPEEAQRRFFARENSDLDLALDDPWF